MHPNLSLYRRIIWAAKRFPRYAAHMRRPERWYDTRSKNRDKVLEEIRQEFRRNAQLGPEEAAPKLKLAHQSLEQLQAYVQLDPNASSWSIKLHQQPMPVPDRQGDER